jgi:DNA-directed RNA polymerase specialized sigma24 family protein
MMHRKPQLSDFEGLIFSTAVRYAPVIADEDVEDIKQILRVKVWQALQAYDRTRSTQDVEAFVFGCMYNRVKDLLKAQERRNDARNGRQLYIEDQEERGAFEAEYLASPTAAEDAGGPPRVDVPLVPRHRPHRERRRSGRARRGRDPQRGPGQRGVPAGRRRDRHATLQPPLLMTELIVILLACALLEFLMGMIRRRAERRQTPRSS